MKIIGVNGSPRKGWNTHILVEESLRGAGIAAGGARSGAGGESGEPSGGTA